MTDKELRRLSRSELLEMLIAQAAENDQLKNRLEQAEAQLRDRKIAINNAGSLAEAALSLNGVFQAAEAAAQQYLENIERISGQQDGHEKDRPKEVIVQLLRDGKVYDTVTLNAANNWRHTWTGLNDRYTWTIVEKELEGYTVKVTREGITFVVTNTYKEDIPDKPAPTPPTTPAKPPLPQTGQLWWPVPVLASAGLLFVVIGLVRRRGAENEKREKE